MKEVGCHGSCNNDDVTIHSCEGIQKYISKIHRTVSDLTSTTSCTRDVYSCSTSSPKQQQLEYRIE